MARKLSISFKEITKDIALYSYLKSLEDMSTEVKRLIRLALAVEEEQKK